MRILFVNNLCGYFGGVEQVVEDYSRGLARRGHVCFLAYMRNGKNFDTYASSFTETYFCPELGDSGFSGGSLFDQIIKRVRPDVVFVHKVIQLPSGIEVNNSFRKVVMVHDHDLWCPKGTGYYTLSRRTCRVKAGLPCVLDAAFLGRREDGIFPIRFRSIGAKFREIHRYHKFDSILVLSEYLKRKLILNGFPSERIRINNPVLDQNVSESHSMLNTRRVLYVGSLIRGKGVDMLLRAMALVSSPFKLDIVGVGKSEAYLRNLASKLKLGDRVNFVGWIPHDKLSSFYHNARVVAVPSIWPEPFGLIGQEAMRFGRPVVAFNVGGIPDWCDNGETGIVVPEQDIEAFAAAIQGLLDDYELARKMGLGGMRKAASYFQFENNLVDLESHLYGS